MVFKLSDITDPPPAPDEDESPRPRLRQPVYQQDVYLEALEKHYNECGIEFDRAKFEPVTRVRAPSPERDIKFTSPPMDRVYLHVKCTKTRVHVKIDSSLYDLHERYYALGKAPPLRSLVAAYKSMGFPRAYIKKLERSRRRAKEILQNPTVLKLIETKTTKKKKTKKIATTSRDDAQEQQENDDDANQSEKDEDDGESDGGESDGEEAGYDFEEGDNDDLVFTDDDGEYCSVSADEHDDL